MSGFNKTSEAQELIDHCTPPTGGLLGDQALVLLFKFAILEDGIEPEDKMFRFIKAAQSHVDRSMKRKEENQLENFAPMLTWVFLLFQSFLA